MKYSKHFCLSFLVWCLLPDYRTQEFRVGTQVGEFCFDDFHSFMAPQITSLYLEFLLSNDGFLCAPIVLIFGIEDVESLVFLKDKIFCLQFERLSKIVTQTFQCLVLVGAVVWTCTSGTTNVSFEPCPTLRISCFYFIPKQLRAVYLFFPFIEINTQRVKLTENT